MYLLLTSDYLCSSLSTADERMGTLNNDRSLTFPSYYTRGKTYLFIPQTSTLDELVFFSFFLMIKIIYLTKLTTHTYYV